MQTGIECAIAVTLNCLTCSQLNSSFLKFDKKCFGSYVVYVGSAYYMEYVDKCTVLDIPFYIFHSYISTVCIEDVQRLQDYRITCIT